MAILTNIRQNWILAGIIFVGFALRIIGLNFGQPFRYHPDELKLVYWAGNMLDVSKWSPGMFFLIGVYPPLYAFVLAAAFGLYSVFLLVTNAMPGIEAIQSMYYSEPFAFHMIGRWISALSGTTSIYVLYLIGKKAYSPKTGVVAALLLATCFLHVRNSHFGVVDAMLILLILSSFYYSLSIISKPTLRNYVLAAIFASAATATKWNAALIVLPFLLAHVFADSEKGWIRKIVSPKLWFTALAGLISFLIFCPQVFLDFNEWWGGVVGTARFQQSASTKLGAGGGFFSYFTGNHSPGYGFFYDNSFIAALGPFVTLFFVLGIIYLLWRHKKTDFLVLLFPLITYLMVGDMKYKAMRHLLPLVPFLLLIAAEFVNSIISDIVKPPVFKRICSALIIALMVIPTGLKALRYDMALCQVDTRTRMKNWIESNVPDGTKIGVEEFHPPLLAQKDLNLDKIRKSPHYKRVYDVYGLVPKMFAHGKQRTADHNPVKYILENKIEYIVLDSFTYERYHWKLTRERNPELVEQRDQFYQWVQDNTEELYQVNPENAFNISPKLTIHKVRAIGN